MTLSEELKWRGFVNQTTFTDPTILDKQKLTFYFGVDPSADSMQIGNLASAMMAKLFISHGHKAVLLVGGATGLIGDPDGKKQERDLQTQDQIDHNKKSIAHQYSTVFSGQKFEVVDNYDWFKHINFLGFLRDVGKHVPMRQMLGREFVQSRLAEDGAGISYAEFSYSLIQGYDFLHLYREKGVTLQLCGADQWGNSITGVNLIRRIEGAEAHVWSAPLIVNKTTGIKFGKSEGGAIWLDSAKTSVFKFYQFWLNCDDAGVIDYLKVFTSLDKATIDDISKQFAANPAERLAQKTLAYEVTKLIHGKDRAESVKKISEVLFAGREYSELSKQEFEQLSKELPHSKLKAGTELVEVLVASELAGSKGEARRFMASKAIYLNGRQADETKTTLEKSDAMHGYVVMKRGKNLFSLVELS